MVDALSLFFLEQTAASTTNRLMSLFFGLELSTANFGEHARHGEEQEPLELVDSHATLSAVVIFAFAFVSFVSVWYNPAATLHRVDDVDSPLARCNQKTSNKPREKNTQAAVHLTDLPRHSTPIR